MRHLGNRRGIALLAVMGVILALLPVAAAIAVQTRLDGLMQRNARVGAEVFYTAEAGLAHAVSELRPLADFDEILRGPDGIDGTPDDGSFPFRTSIPPAFTQGSLVYEVTASRGPASTIRIRSHGRGHHETVRQAEALVRPADTPFTPAAIYVEAPDLDIDLGDRDFQLSGMVDSQVAGLALSSAEVAARLRQTITPAIQVTGAGGSPSVTAVAAIDLDSYARALRRRLDAAIHGDPNDAILGTQDHPRLTVVETDWTIGNAVEGFGILLIRGDLEIEGRLGYAGLVVVEGNLILKAPGDLRIDGSLWVSNSGAVRVHLLGAGHVRYSPVALERTDAAVARAILHRAVVVGWREGP
jgi:hypothetical protein